MKKALTLLGILLLSACSAQKPVSTAEIADRFSGDFSAKITVETAEDVFQMEATKTGMSIAFSVTDPPELSGLSTVLEDGRATLSYEGISMDFPTERLPAKAPFLQIGTAFSALQDESAFSVEQRKTGLLVSGDGFSALLEPESLALKELVFPAEKSKMTVGDFVFSGKKEKN